MTASVDEPIDLDAQVIWPEATRRWAEEHADRLADSTEFLADLAISLEQEDEFRQTFGLRTLVAYHCTRLLPHARSRRNPHRRPASPRRAARPGPHR